MLVKRLVQRAERHFLLVTRLFHSTSRSINSRSVFSLSSEHLHARKVDVSAEAWTSRGKGFPISKCLEDLSNCLIGTGAISFRPQRRSFLEGRSHSAAGAHPIPRVSRQSPPGVPPAFRGNPPPGSLPRFAASPPQVPPRVSRRPPSGCPAAPRRRGTLHEDETGFGQSPPRLRVGGFGGSVRAPPG